MARISELHEKWMKDPTYRKAYADLEEETGAGGRQTMIISPLKAAEQPPLEPGDATPYHRRSWFGRLWVRIFYPPCLACGRPAKGNAPLMWDDGIARRGNWMWRCETCGRIEERSPNFDFPGS